MTTVTIDQDAVRELDLYEEGGKRANLRGAYLQGAYLQGAYLRDADLQGAYLQGANLQGADLGEFTPEQIVRLDAVRDIVLNNPERLYMADWHQGGWTPEHTPEEERTCGSAHCIAGWLQALSPDQAIRDMEPIEAGILLAPPAAPLFYADDATVLEWFKERGYARTRDANH